MARPWTLVWLVPVALARPRVLRRLERQRRSRVITLIHRQESRSSLGIPIDGPSLRSRGRPTVSRGGR